MLTELKNVRQIEGEARRRWFADEYFDLIAWLDGEGAPSGFQLCYGKPDAEHALTWDAQTGFTHRRVDDGESAPYKNMTPVLVPDGAFPASDVIRRFMESSEDMESAIREFVLKRLEPISKSLPAARG